MGDRVGPVGTGETSSFVGASGGTQRISPVNWSAILDRQEALVSTNDLRASAIVYFGLMRTFMHYCCHLTSDIMIMADK